PRGGSAVLTVPVIRRGYNGPIQLAVADLPPGLLAHGGHVPANGAFGTLTLTASAQTATAAAASLLRIEGKATSAGKEIRRLATQRIVLSQEAQAGGAMVTLTRFMLGLAGAEPFNIQGPAEVEVVLGYSSAVPVTVGRVKEQMALAVEVNGNVPQPPPLPGQPAPVSPLTFKPGVA